MTLETQPATQVTTQPAFDADTQRKIDGLWEVLRPVCRLLEEVDAGMHPELVEKARRNIAQTRATVKAETT